MNISLTVANEPLILFSDKAALWRDTLLLADAHFGKAATFRRAGIPIPAGTTEMDLARISRLLAETGARRLFFLGDFAHEGGAMESGTLDQLAQWRKTAAPIEMTLIAGNHDRRIDSVCRHLSMRTVAQVADGPFLFTHLPPENRQRSKAYVVAGHIHPAVRMVGEGGDRLRAACFWFTPGYGVLPAFGSFTGLHDVTPQAEDAVIVVGDSALVKIQGGNPGWGGL